MLQIKKTIFALAISLLIVSCSSEMKKENQEVNNDKHSSMLVLSAQDRLLANIKSDSALIKTISEMTILVGKTKIDERKVEVITARVKGRVEELFINKQGEYIAKGQAVYSLYSEELLADENDYLNTIKQYNSVIAQKEIAKQLMDAAKKKLLSWTLTEAQINEIENSKKASSLMKFYSPYTGYLIEFPVREGEYVDAGTTILKIADLSTLWIESQIYGEEVKYLGQNPSLLVEFETYPNEIYEGQIVFDNPSLEEEQKVNLVRVQVNNSYNKLKPGMMAYLYLKRNEKIALVVPKSAVLYESATSVWIEDNDGMFEQRMVTTGIENKKEVEVLSGLKPGEKVVISGAYFLKSESIIRKGGDDMGGMKM